MSQQVRRWLGGIILLCGGGLTALVLLKGNIATENPADQALYTNVIPENDTAEAPAVEPNFQPLALDVEQEQALLAAENAKRADLIAQQELQAQAFLEQQQAAEQSAAAGLRDDAKPNTPATVAATAVPPTTALPATTTTTTTTATATPAPSEVKPTPVVKPKPVEVAVAAKPEPQRRPWMVQIALTKDQAAAKKIEKQLTDKGYKVTLSKTSKGIRVLVGDENSKSEAEKVLAKVNRDKVATGAWVINWTPAE